MTRMWPPGDGTRRPPALCVAAPREAVDPARIGRRVVRRRAKGMDAGAVAAAIEDARFDARQASRHEDLADEARGPAELAEWERLDQMLAAAPAGTVYDPDIDDVVQAELAAEAAAAAAREAELREAMRIAARADELQALRELGTLEQTEPRDGDEAVRDELTCRAGGYVQADVDAWLAHALAAHRGHYRDPAARQSAAGLLTPPVLAHAALLAERAYLVPGADVDELAFAARLANTNHEAVDGLAGFLARARSETSRSLTWIRRNKDVRDVQAIMEASAYVRHGGVTALGGCFSSCICPRTSRGGVAAGPSATIALSTASLPRRCCTGQPNVPADGARSFYPSHRNAGARVRPGSQAARGPSDPNRARVRSGILGVERDTRRNCIRPS